MTITSVYLPDERPILTTRQSRIVIFRPPHRYLLLILLVLLICALFGLTVLWWPLGAFLVLGLAWRWYYWREERIVLTTKRIIRFSGVPETTTVEAFLRIDRIAGIVVERNFLARLVRAGDLHLEAPGDHQVLRRLEWVADVTQFYRALRGACFDHVITSGPDPDEVGDWPPGDVPSRWPDDDAEQDYVTEPLPPVRPPRVRSWRHTP